MNKKKIVIIVIGVVILALIAGVLYYLFHRQEVGLNKKDVWKQVGVDHFEYPIKSSDYENGDVNWDINRNTKDNAINVTVDVNVSDADAKQIEDDINKGKHVNSLILSPWDLYSLYTTACMEYHPPYHNNYEKKFKKTDEEETVEYEDLVLQYKVNGKVIRKERHTNAEVWQLMNDPKVLAEKEAWTEPIHVDTSKEEALNATVPQTGPIKVIDGQTVVN